MAWNGIERRQFPRVQFTCKVRVKNSAEIFNVLTENIGPGGMRVIMPRECVKEMQLWLEITTSAAKVIKCNGKVVWVMKKIDIKDNKTLLFDTGIQFEDINEEDKKYINNFLKQAGKPAA